MLWILPKFFCRNKNVVYPYLGKKGCDENDGAKGSGKVLDPDSPSALAALSWTGMWLLFVQQMDGAVTKGFRRNWFCSGFDADFLHNVEQITYAKKKDKLREAKAFKPVFKQWSL